jgi:hypothetical protein
MASLRRDKLPVSAEHQDDRITGELARGFRDVGDREHDDLSSEQSLYLPGAQTDLAAGAGRKRRTRLLHGLPSRCRTRASCRGNAPAAAAAYRHPGDARRCQSRGHVYPAIHLVSISGS